MNRIGVRGWPLLFLLPVLGFLPFLGEFTYARGADFSDLAISHLPNALWIQRSLSEWGQIPLWSNTILSGYPFSADPLSGLHYPPGWLAFLFPQPFGLNLVMVFHLIFAGIGMYLFLRAENLGRPAALFGALAYEMMPKLMAHLASGHVSLVYSVSWTPWLLLAERRKQRNWWLPGAVLGIMTLADPRWAALGGLLWLAYGLRICLSEEAPGRFTQVQNWALNGLMGAVLAGVLSAALLLPLGEYVQLSTRSGMSTADILSFSLPPEQLLGLLTPPLGGTAEYVLYPGALVFCLVVMGLAFPVVRKKTRFWYFVILSCLIISLGASLPGSAWLASLPGVSLLRVPTRALFATGLALSILAAHTLQAIGQEPEVLRRMGRFNPLLLLVGLAFLLLLFCAVGWSVTGEFPLRFAWGGVALSCALALVFIQRARPAGRSFFYLWAGIILVLDCCISNLIGVEFRPAPSVMGEHQALAQFLAQAGSLERIYSPSYSLPQQTAAGYHLELADGVDPLQLRAYVEYMRPASGVLDSSYSVTLPAFKNGDPARDNQTARLNARLLGLMNIHYVAAEFPIQADGLDLVGQFDATYLYRNTAAFPRAWVQPVGTLPGQAASVSPAKVDWTPNRIEVNASGPGRLILAELAYPGWVASIDGNPAEMQKAFLFRSVDLPKGDHQVVFTFMPWTFFGGVGISLAGWLSLVAAWMLTKRRVG